MLKDEVMMAFLVLRGGLAKLFDLIGISSPTPSERA
jgi:hypothetical protein